MTHGVQIRRSIGDGSQGGSEGLITCDYLVYPVGAALADKLRALSGCHNSRASSRMKKPVDIVVYALTCDIDGNDLRRRVQREIAVRKLGPMGAFPLPEEWDTSQARQYARLCAQTGIPKQLHDIGEASELAARLFNHVLNQQCSGLRWSHADLGWK